MARRARPGQEPDHWGSTYHYGGINSSAVWDFSNRISDGRVPAVTVFDWDDVLCPTTFVGLLRAGKSLEKRHVSSGTECAGHQGGHQVPITPSQRAQLRLVEAGVVDCVKAALRHGPVVIVTNADERWVRASTELFLQKAACILAEVEIVSARERFEGHFPRQPACWKIAAISYVANCHFKPHESCLDGAGALVSVISGNGRHEKAATQTLTRHHPQVIAKTVSLVRNPTPEAMHAQLELLAANFGWIYGIDPTPAIEDRTRSPRTIKKSRDWRAQVANLKDVSTEIDEVKLNDVPVSGPGESSELDCKVPNQAVCPLSE